MSDRLTIGYNRTYSDMPFLDGWMQARSLSFSPNDLPENGSVVYGDDGPVAAGFIRLVEGNYAWIDSCVTNPASEPSLRDKAMNLLALALISRAKKLGISHILAFSLDENTLVRSQSFGFERLPYAVISLDLGSKKAG